MLLIYIVIEYSIIPVIIAYYRTIAMIIVCSISAILIFSSICYPKHLTLCWIFDIFIKKHNMRAYSLKPWLLVDSFYQLLLPSKQ